MGFRALTVDIPLTIYIDDFPMAQIKEVNNPTTIKFTLTSAQTGAATLRIGTTLAFAGGRPQVTVNGWLGPAPSAPVDVSRINSKLHNCRQLIERVFL